MKKFILFFVGISVVLLIVSWFCHQNEYELDPDEKAVNSAIGYNIKFIKDKYNLIPFGTGISMPGGDIQYLELSFQVYGPLSKEKLRRMMVEAASDFLTNLNDDAELCSFLDKGKFDIEEIGVKLFVIDRSGGDLDHPHISIASISRGRLKYLTFANDECLSVVSREQESFEEAMHILRSRGEYTAAQAQDSVLPKRSVESDRL